MMFTFAERMCVFARLTFSNPGVAAPAAGVVCAAALHFWDGQGTLLKSATVSVLPGKSAYLDLFEGRDLGTLEVIDASSGKTQEVLGVGHLVAGPTVAAGNP